MSILDTTPHLRGYAPRPVATPLRADAADVVARTPDPLVRRLLRAKKAYSTRFVAAAVEADPAAFDLSVDPTRAPRPGDVVLARVVTIGQHRRLESPASRRQILFEGDEILVAYGSRYAADQFHAVIPEDLGECHLAAAGGLASRVVDQHAAIKDATVIEPVGLLATADGVVNLSAYAPHPVRPAPQHGGAAARVPVVAVVGTSMNSGKSTTLACLARGLTAAGRTVHAGKATGTGAGNDANHYTDAGADLVVDFTDFGLPSTFGLCFEDVRDVFATMADVLASPAGHAPDVVLIEIADGLYQGDTRRLLTDDAFRSVVDRVVFAAGDALGASGGVGALRALGCEPSLVSGVLTASPLATAEARAALDVRVVPTFDLCLPGVALSAAGLAPAGDLAAAGGLAAAGSRVPTVGSAGDGHAVA